MPRTTWWNWLTLRTDREQTENQTVIQTVYLLTHSHTFQVVFWTLHTVWNILYIQLRLLVSFQIACKHTVKSTNECHQSFPLPPCDLSQSTEAQRTPSSRSVLQQRQRSANSSSRIKPLWFPKSMQTLCKAKFSGSRIGRDKLEVFAEDEIKSRQDIRMSHRVKAARPSLCMSARHNNASGRRPSCIQMGW